MFNYFRNNNYQELIQNNIHLYGSDIPQTVFQKGDAIVETVVYKGGNSFPVYPTENIDELREKASEDIRISPMKSLNMMRSCYAHEDKIFENDFQPRLYGMAVPENTEIITTKNSVSIVEMIDSKMYVSYGILTSVSALKGLMTELSALESDGNGQDLIFCKNSIFKLTSILFEKLFLSKCQIEKKEYEIDLWESTDVLDGLSVRLTDLKKICTLDDQTGQLELTDDAQIFIAIRTKLRCGKVSFGQEGTKICNDLMVVLKNFGQKIPQPKNKFKYAFITESAYELDRLLFSGQGSTWNTQIFAELIPTIGTTALDSNHKLFMVQNGNSVTGEAHFIFYATPSSFAALSEKLVKMGRLSEDDQWKLYKSVQCDPDDLKERYVLNLRAMIEYYCRGLMLPLQCMLTGIVPLESHNSSIRVIMFPEKLYFNGNTPAWKALALDHNVFYAFGINFFQQFPLSLLRVGPHDKMTEMLNIQRGLKIAEYTNKFWAQSGVDMYVEYSILDYTISGQPLVSNRDDSIDLLQFDNMIRLRILFDNVYDTVYIPIIGLAEEYRGNNLFTDYLDGLIGVCETLEFDKINYIEVMNDRMMTNLTGRKYWGVQIDSSEPKNDGGEIKKQSVVISIK